MRSGGRHKPWTETAGAYYFKLAPELQTERIMLEKCLGYIWSSHELTAWTTDAILVGKRITVLALCEVGDEAQKRKTSEGLVQ